MTEPVSFAGRDGSVLVVDVVDSAPAVPVRGIRPSEVLEAARQSLEDVVDNIAAPAQAIARRLAATEHVDEVQVEFAVRLTAEAGVVVTKLVGEANFRIVLTLRPGSDPAASSPGARITEPVPGVHPQ